MLDFGQILSFPRQIPSRWHRTLDLVEQRPFLRVDLSVDRSNRLRRSHDVFKVVILIGDQGPRFGWVEAVGVVCAARLSVLCARALAQAGCAPAARSWPGTQGGGAG